MRIKRPALLAVIAVLLNASAGSETPATDRAVAVTFDDLPASAAGAVGADTASLEDRVRFAHHKRRRVYWLQDLT